MLTFQIVATDEHRLLSRILQVLEGQRIHVQVFSGTVLDGIAYISATLECGSDRAYRLEALLYRLQGVRSMTISPVRCDEPAAQLIP